VDEVTQTTLARYSDIHKVQLSQMVKALEEKGMVGRKTSPTDVRAKSISVTELGLERMV
jgi:DNA-binding MarR family transcriptional regulator